MRHSVPSWTQGGAGAAAGPVSTGADASSSGVTIHRDTRKNAASPRPTGMASHHDIRAGHPSWPHPGLRANTNHVSLP
jgi:hypothetical protein